MPSDKMLVPTQGDRDAAAEQCARIWNEKGAIEVREGKCDSFFLVQAFARHASTARKEGLEAAAKIVDRHVQQARDNVADCKAWSPAQGEWSRARDFGLDIAEAIRDFSPPDEALGHGEG